jgi:hypothetical protein
VRHSGSHSGKTWACRKDCTAIQAVAVAEARGSDERRNPRIDSFSALRSVAGCKSVRLHRREAVVEYRHSEGSRAYTACRQVAAAINGVRGRIAERGAAGPVRNASGLGSDPTGADSSVEPGVF